MSRRIALSLWMLAAILSIMTLTATGFGALPLPVSLLWNGSDEAMRQIWLTIRLPRVLLALVIGGALALAVANRVLMLENAVYSILSPEGFASILWKDAGRSGEAAELMRMTAADLLELGVADEVIPEPEGGAHSDPQEVFEAVDRSLSAALARVVKEGSFAARRQEKFRRMGSAAPWKENP